MNRLACIFTTPNKVGILLFVGLIPPYLLQLIQLKPFKKPDKFQIQWSCTAQTIVVQRLRKGILKAVH